MQIRWWIWWILSLIVQLGSSESIAHIWTMFLWRICRRLADLWKIPLSSITHQHLTCSSQNALCQFCLGTTIQEIMHSSTWFLFLSNYLKLMMWEKLSLVLWETTPTLWILVQHTQFASSWFRWKKEILMRAHREIWLYNNNLHQTTTHLLNKTLILTIWRSHLRLIKNLQCAEVD